MKQQTRTVKSIQDEIKHLKTEHLNKYGVRKFRAGFPVLMGKNELDSVNHIAYLEGYLRAVRDERGLK